jgi:hypothetical protein
MSEPPHIIDICCRACGQDTRPLRPNSIIHTEISFSSIIVLIFVEKRFISSEV